MMAQDSNNEGPGIQVTKTSWWQRAFGRSNETAVNSRNLSNPANPGHHYKPTDLRAADAATTEAIRAGMRELRERLVANYGLERKVVFHMSDEEVLAKKRELGIKI